MTTAERYEACQDGINLFIDNEFCGCFSSRREAQSYAEAARIVAVHGNEIYFFVNGEQAHASVTAGEEAERRADAQDQGEVFWPGLNFEIEIWA